MRRERRKRGRVPGWEPPAHLAGEERVPASALPLPLSAHFLPFTAGLG